MTAIDRTAYPRFRATLTPSELHEHFTPTADELALCEAQTPDTAGKLALLVLYKCLQALNYLPAEEEIPPEVVAHLRWYLQLHCRYPVAGVTPLSSALRSGHSPGHWLEVCCPGSAPGGAHRRRTSTPRAAARATLARARLGEG